MISYKANRLDRDIYFSLRESIGWHNFSKTQTEKALQNSVYDVVAYDSDVLIGMGRLVGDGALYCYVQDVVVHPDYQGRGIGTEILNQLLAYIDQIIEEDGRMSVGLVAAQGKESFYEQFGFKQIPHEFSGAGMRKVIRK